MNTMTQSNSVLQSLFQGRIAFVRYWAYLGMILGATALALWGGDGYSEDNYIFMLVSMQGVIWLGTGALLAAGAAIVASMLRPDMGRSSTASMMVPWFDGGVLMIVLMIILTMFEPTASMVSYEDQSNLFAGRVIMAMNVFDPSKDKDLLHKIEQTILSVYPSNQPV